MTGPCEGQDDARLSARGRALRRRLAELALAVAATEDSIADTFDSLANTRPRDALRLHHRAAQARAYASKERDQAGVYSTEQ